jgi:Ca2+-binding RTX toxin-like protein
MTIFGTAGNDDLDGTSGNDKFDLSQGGKDIARGLDGRDAFAFGNTFTDKDSIVGGSGRDTLKLLGDYSAGLNFRAAQIESIEQVTLLAGEFVYDIAFKDSAVAAGSTMTVNATAVFGLGHMFLDASSEQDAAFAVKGSAGNDIIVTGLQSDDIDGGPGADFIRPRKGQDIVNGGEGNDTFLFGTGDLDPLDRIADVHELGAGNTVVLDGNYAGGLVFEAKTMRNIDFLELRPGHDYALDLGAAKLGDDVFLTLNAPLLGGDTVHFDARGMKHYLGSFLSAGLGNDVLFGGARDDFLIGSLGADRTEGDRGEDAYGYNGVADSTGSAYDIAVGFNAHQDRVFPFFTLATGEVSGVGDKVSGGALSEASFDADLAAAIGPGELEPDFAVLFQPDAGDLAGKLFLIIDGNRVDGYQAGADLVVRLTAAEHMGDFSIDNFG